MNNTTRAAFNLSLDSQARCSTSQKTFEGVSGEQILIALSPWVKKVTLGVLSTSFGRVFPQAFPHSLDLVGLPSHYGRELLLTSSWKRPEQLGDCSYSSVSDYILAFSDCKRDCLRGYLQLLVIVFAEKMHSLYTLS